MEIPIILLKIKNHELVLGGMIMIPLVKFKLFDTDLNTTITEVKQNVSRVSEHLQKWDTFLSQINNTSLYHFLQNRTLIKSFIDNIKNIK